MPAEWEEHGATFLTWPREEGISFPGRFERIPRGVGGAGAIIGCARGGAYTFFFGVASRDDPRSFEGDCRGGADGETSFMERWGGGANGVCHSRGEGTMHREIGGNG
jgi:hypothetical protein